jgi:hypothetical protein
MARDMVKEHFMAQMIANVKLCGKMILFREKESVIVKRNPL